MFTRRSIAPFRVAMVAVARCCVAPSDEAIRGLVIGMQHFVSAESFAIRRSLLRRAPDSLFSYRHPLVLLEFVMLDAEAFAPVLPSYLPPFSLLLLQPLPLPRLRSLNDLMPDGPLAQLVPREDGA